jgi:ketosteroid isomerase-like protein
VVLEFPYAPSLGMADRFEGKAIAVAYLRKMLDQLSGLTLRDIRSYAVEGDPDTVFNEYEGDAVTADGTAYTQIYMNKMRFCDGRLVLLRELWNPMKVYEATHGAYDGTAAA